MSDAKERILTAAVDEFGEYGFDMASTNRIMESAGVSKGLIFHYFGSKRELYIICARRIIDNYLEGYYRMLDAEENDCFKRLDMAVVYKTKFFAENIAWSRLMLDVNRLTAQKRLPELAETLDEARHKLLDALTSGLDMSRYNKKYPAGKVIEFMLLAIEAYASRYNFEDITYEQTMGLFENFTIEMEFVKEMILHGVLEPV